MTYECYACGDKDQGSLGSDLQLGLPKGWKARNVVLEAFGLSYRSFVILCSEFCEKRYGRLFPLE